MAVLIFNAGSSTLKVSLTEASGDRIAAWRDGGSHVTDIASAADYRPAVHTIVAEMRDFIESSPRYSLEAVVHRVVFGGAQFRDPVVIDARVRAQLAEGAQLAPLHNPPSLAVIDAARAALPHVPHVAVFDTAFHATLAPEAFMYPIPLEWSERWMLRRFGFHGPSHAYCAERAAVMLGRREVGFKVVVAHLGNGASMTAISDGKSVDTTMGFTPVEGLMMGTRTGSVDPGLLLHLLLRCGIGADALEQAVNRKSGLLGVSGVSADMREVIQALDQGNQRADLAFRMFVHRARASIGALAVTLGRVDALVFTAGIGEHSPRIRAAICDGLECLGLELDQERNAAAQSDAVVSTPNSVGAILVIATREDVMLARAAMACVRADAVS